MICTGLFNAYIVFPFNTLKGEYKFRSYNGTDLINNVIVEKVENNKVKFQNKNSNPVKA